MTVSELIAALQEYPGDFDVIIERQGDYSPFCDSILAQYIPTETWFGEIVTEEDGPDDGFTENNCVVLQSII